jgi:hypothetical protein
MEVYVVPIGQDQYELYFEPSTGAESEAEQVGGFIGRLGARFAEMIRAAESRRLDKQPAPGSWVTRLQERSLGWVAQRISEQRLLWSLRRQTAASAVHPQDMAFEHVLTLIRRTLRRDFERHRLWLVIDTAGLIASGPLALVPGPNVLAYFFAFRVCGHWLSMRGATRGLHRVAWSGRPCSSLTELRALPSLAPAEREARIRDVADRLRLQHLATFFARVAVRHA